MKPTPASPVADAERGATFSQDRRYRYALWRAWRPSEPRVLFVMLNPSIADEVRDDPTQRRCRRFALDWGFGGYSVGNLFALVSTDPRALRAAGDPVGPGNDDALMRLHAEHDLTVAAWGAGGRFRGRGKAVGEMLSRTGSLACIGVCKDGSPRHPLYLRADAARRPLR